MSLLYQGLIMGEHNLPTVARRSGISYDKLLKLCHGHLNLLAEDLPKLYRGTQDLDFVADLSGFRDCDLLISRRGEATGEFRAPSTIMLSLNAAVGELSQFVAEAERDNHWSDEERAAFALRLEKAERRIQALRLAVVKKEEMAG